MDTADDATKLRAALDAERTLRRIHDACRESAEKEVDELRAALAQCREEREAATRIGAEASAGLLEAYEGQVAHTDLVRAEYQKRLAAATAALAAARLALGAFVDDHDCHLDHHGYCQTHGVTKPCAVQVARALLAGEGTK